jgi:hypothetical protein
VSRRLALAAFLLYGLVAIGVLFEEGSRYWFFGDDWGLLAGRDASDPADLLRPQNGHWSTIPIVVYRMLFELFGLHTYAPYQGTVIVLHLFLAVLIRVVMRRAGVGPWIATITASTFVLYGSAEQNIFQSIQMGTMASLVAGFGHLILADHDGPFDRRDWLGLAAGFVSLMSSGVGPITAAIVGGATLLRRGWRAALFHVTPLAGVYLLWASSQSKTFSGVYSLESMFEWIQLGVLRTTHAFTQHDTVSVALAVLMVVGLAAAWLPLDWKEFRTRAAAPMSLFIAPILLFCAVSGQRFFFGPETIGQSRYVGIATAFALPAVGLAAGALVRSWRASLPLVVVIIMWGIPANIDLLGRTTLPARVSEQHRAFLLAAAYSPLADQVRPGVHPDPHHLRTYEVTTGWLVAARDSGRLPEEPRVDSATRNRVTVRLSLSQDIAELPPHFVCTEHTDPVELDLELGEQLGFEGEMQVTLLQASTPMSRPVAYSNLWSGRLLQAELAGLRVRLQPRARATSFVLCRPRGLAAGRGSHLPCRRSPRDAQGCWLLTATHSPVM